MTDATGKTMGLGASTMRSAVVHELKTWPNCWDATKRGEKLWEVRKNDRCYQSGDTVRLQRWNPHPTIGGPCYEMQSGKRSSYPQEEGTQKFRIGWLLHGGQFGIEPGYCVFSLEPLQPEGCKP